MTDTLRREYEVLELMEVGGVRIDLLWVIRVYGEDKRPTAGVVVMVDSGHLGQLRAEEPEPVDIEDVPGDVIAELQERIVDDAMKLESELADRT